MVTLVQCIFLVSISYMYIIIYVIVVVGVDSISVPLITQFDLYHVGATKAHVGTQPLIGLPDVPYWIAYFNPRLTKTQ